MSRSGERCAACGTEHAKIISRQTQFRPALASNTAQRASRQEHRTCRNSSRVRLITGHRLTNVTGRRKKRFNKVEVTKALAALQPLYGKDNVEVITEDGTRVRGTVRSLKTTQALTTPSVKIERGDGQVVKIPFNQITEIIDHNSVEEDADKREEGRGFFGRRFLLNFF